MLRATQTLVRRFTDTQPVKRPTSSLLNKPSILPKKIQNQPGQSTAAPKLCGLPPATEAFEQNVYRAHFQVAQWYSA